MIILTMLFCCVTFFITYAADTTPNERKEAPADFQITIRSFWHNDFTGQTSEICNTVKPYVERSKLLQVLIEDLGNTREINGKPEIAPINIPDNLCHSTVVNLLSKPTAAIKELNASGYESEMLFEVAHYLQI